MLGVEAAVVDDAVATLRLGPAGQGSLSDFLTRRPDGLTSGSSDLPAEAARSIAALLERQVFTTRPPRCLTCGQERSLRHRVGLLLLGLLGRDRGKALVARNAMHTRWVFPGGTPGRHLTADMLRV